MKTVYTIGFAGKSARQFFDLLQEAGIRRLMDVRINNTSQLAGFTKKDDLAYFLDKVLGVQYVHEPLLAPTEELLRAYRNKEINWDGYVEQFLKLMHDRAIERHFTPNQFQEPSVLLCSEPTAEECHRRLVLEYLQRHWNEDLNVVHL
jgi:uncharacterized protein (DUF488 family)